MKLLWAILLLCSVAVGQQAVPAQSSKQKSLTVTPAYRCNGCLRAFDDKYFAKVAAHKKKLYWALRTRVLTDKEMAEVESFDYWLLVDGWRPYDEAVKIAEFNQALLQQYKIRDIAAKAQGCTHREGK